LILNTLGDIYISTEYLKTKDAFLYAFRHEFQHLIQSIINFPVEDNKFKDSLINKNPNSSHQDRVTEYDARFTEFAYSIRDENWDYLFDDVLGVFSYGGGSEKLNLHFSYYAEYLKDYNKQQIYTKLYQLGVTNKNIVNFKIEFKNRLSDFLNSDRRDIRDLNFIKKIINRLIINLASKMIKYIPRLPVQFKFFIFFDLFIEGEPLNKLCKNFDIDPYSFLDDYNQRKFLTMYGIFKNTNVDIKKQLPDKINPDFITMKLKKDKYWKNLI
jgi:hypothetical protein